MEKRVIPFSPPDISELEINEVVEALRSGWITTGPRVKTLEKRLAEYCHTSKVVCLNSATAAEELNFRVCGIGEGDEVIVPAYTYTASASAAIHCGAKVVFVDSQKDNCEMDYDAVTEKITDRTKAVVAVDLGGIVADYDKLYAAVESKRALFRPKQGDSLGARIQQSIGRVLVFADCAHALGAQWHGKMAGEIADFTDFSFHAVKNFTTAEGGASTWRDIEGIDNEVLEAGNYQHALLMEDSLLWTNMIMNGAYFKNIDEYLVLVRTGEDMFQRRGGYSYYKKYKEGRRLIYNTGYISRWDYLYTLGVQLVFSLLPNKLRKFVYEKLLRE